MCYRETMENGSAHNLQCLLNCWLKVTDIMTRASPSVSFRCNSGNKYSSYLLQEEQKGTNICHAQQFKRTTTSFWRGDISFICVGVVPTAPILPSTSPSLEKCSSLEPQIVSWDSRRNAGRKEAALMVRRQGGKQDRCSGDRCRCRDKPEMFLKRDQV